MVLQSTLTVIGGLCLFLYGMNLMSTGMEALSGSVAHRVLHRCTGNLLMGILTGVLATVLLDSSSLVIILLLGMVNGKLIRLEQAMGVILGANIGTTASTQLFALNVEELGPVALAVGLGLQTLGKPGAQKTAGTLLAGVGLLFFGLNQMSLAAEPWRDSPRIAGLVVSLEQPILGALAGAVVTAIIQSSSAMMGIVIALAAKGAMSVPAGIAMMLGAEIGTCADTLIASVGRSREALRAGLFHLAFNVLSVTLGLLFYRQFVALVEWSSGGASAEQHLANAHILFNVLGVVLFAGLVPAAARMLRQVFPDASETFSTDRQMAPTLGEAG